ncbi:MAG: Hint domain-containing protein, partial [Planctomycetota bacterium]
IGNKTRHAILLRNMLDFAVRMVSDVAIGGENIMWAAAVNLMSFGASGLLLAKYGQKMFGECVARFGGCFVAGTQVVTGYLDDPWESGFGAGSSAVGVAVRRTVTQSIETIELGSRVITEAPDGLASDSEFGEPEQSTWRKITMLQQRRDGSCIETEVLRPNLWIELLGLKEGSVIEFDLPELQTSGTARITAIEPCPLIADGEGRVVIGRFVTRQVSNLLEVEVEDGTSFSGTTTHPVWSVDACDWRAMEELVVGERLQTLTGEVTIRAIRDARRVSDVFNIEVDGEHVYRLLDAGVLVHNANDYGITSPTNRLRVWAQGAGTWLNPRTGKIETFTGILEADHVFPASLIPSIHPKFDQLSREQKSFIFNYPGNFEPLSPSLNRSKRDRLAHEWALTPQGSEIARLNPDYMIQLADRQEAFRGFAYSLIELWISRGNGVI